jgi:transposase
MNWKNLLGSVSESVNDQLRLRNDYLVAENRILRNQIDGRVPLTDSKRRELAEIDAKLGKPALAEIATIAQPDTILAWHRKFTDQKVDLSKPPRSVGRPRVAPEIEEWVIRMACENRSWGYDRIQGSLKHLGYSISDQIVGNILKRHGIPPAPERQKTVTWGEFVRSHWDIFVATGFFNSEVWSWLGLLISFLFCFIHVGRDQVYTIGTSLLQRLPGMSFFGRWSRDLRVYVHSWGLCGRQLSQSLAIRWSKGYRRPTVSQVTTHDDRVPLSQMRAQVVPIPSGSCCQIRDGPKPHRQQLNELLINLKRKAA